MGEISCDLLEISYLCGRINNKKNEKVDFTFVVICSKFLYCQSQIMYKTSPILLP